MSKFFNVQTEGEGASIFLYGEIGENMPSNSAAIVSELMMLEKQYNNITVRINSTGGEVFSGIAIYNALKASKADVKIQIDGVAASMAAVIALCGKPLYMNSYSKLMLHAVSTSVSGNAQTLVDTAEMMKKIQEDLALMVANKCGLSSEEVAARYFDDGADHWLSAKECQELGIIDGIITSEKAPEGESVAEIFNFCNSLLTDGGNFVNEFKQVEGFEELTTKQQILSKIETLINDSKQLRTSAAERLLSKLLSNGVVSSSEESFLKDRLKEDPEKAFEYLSKRDQTAEDERTKAFNAISNIYKLPSRFNEKEITSMKAFYSLDANTFKKLVADKAPQLRASAVWQGNTKEESREGWTLDDYRKKAPNELRENPSLYDKLLKKF